MMAHEARLFRIALQFLTRIPLNHRGDWQSDWLARSAKYMPLVGALIGVVAGVALLLSARVFPAPLPVIIGLAAAIALTGALHEDGLADTVDALGGGQTRDQCLEIMKDSRIGTYGTLALILALALKAGALLSLPPFTAACVLVAGHAGARLAAVLALWGLDHAGGGNAKVSQPVSAIMRQELAIAAVFGLMPGILCLSSTTFVVSQICAFAAAGAAAFVVAKRIGGYTGDTLGAIEQVYETAFFVFAAAMIAGPA
jgi:adenosylcobinamide-GDP ribazoletransferase